MGKRAGLTTTLLLLMGAVSHASASSPDRSKWLDQRPATGGPLKDIDHLPERAGQPDACSTDWGLFLLPLGRMNQEAMHMFKSHASAPCKFGEPRHYRVGG